VRGTNQNDSQVHSEVENLENLGFGERQHHNAGEFCHRDAGKHTTTSGIERLFGPMQICALEQRKRSDNVRDELDTNADALKKRTRSLLPKSSGQFNNHTHHHQIDQRHRVQRNVPNPHQPTHIQNDQGHHEQDNQRRQNVKAGHEESDHKNGQQ
jgi:hypothetical protein